MGIMCGCCKAAVTFASRERVTRALPVKGRVHQLKEAKMNERQKRKERKRSERHTQRDETKVDWTNTEDSGSRGASGPMVSERCFIHGKIINSSP